MVDSKYNSLKIYPVASSELVDPGDLLSAQ